MKKVVKVKIATVPEENQEKSMPRLNRVIGSFLKIASNTRKDVILFTEDTNCLRLLEKYDEKNYPDNLLVSSVERDEENIILKIVLEDKTEKSTENESFSRIDLGNGYMASVGDILLFSSDNGIEGCYYFDKHNKVLDCRTIGVKDNKFYNRTSPFCDVTLKEIQKLTSKEDIRIEKISDIKNETETKATLRVADKFVEGITSYSFITTCLKELEGILSCKEIDDSERAFLEHLKSYKEYIQNYKED